MPLRLLAPANACESLSQYVTRTRMVPCRVTSYYMWHQGSLVRRTLCALPALHLTDTPEGMDVANVSNKAFPIVSYMVPGSELACPHAEHPPRTERAMRQASQLLLPLPHSHQGMIDWRGARTVCCLRSVPWHLQVDTSKMCCTLAYNLKSELAPQLLQQCDFPLCNLKSAVPVRVREH